MEVLIALFIFSIVISGVTTYFARIVSANQNAKRLQQNLEDTRFVMNRMAKVLRTSVIIDPTGDARRHDLRVYDYSQKKCLIYVFDSDVGLIERVSSASPASGVDEKSWCAGLSISNFSQNTLISVSGSGASLSGFFSIVPSVFDPSNRSSNYAGGVTMQVTIRRNNTASTVQSTVSLRNFKEAYTP